MLLVSYCLCSARSPGMHPGSSVLLANVSIDSEMSMSTDSSINISELEEVPRGFHGRPVGPVRRQRSPMGPISSITDPHHPDYMELESVGSNPSTHRSHGNPHHPAAAGNPHPQSKPTNTSNPNPPEPLMAAQIRPAKEKSNNHHTKEVESGEKSDKRSPSSPARQYPRSLNVGPAVTVQKSPGYVSQDMGGDSSGESTPSEEYQTPSVESVPFEPPLRGLDKLAQPSEGEPEPEDHQQFEAFHVENNAGPTPRGGAMSPPSLHGNRYGAKTSQFTLLLHVKV